MYFLPVVVNVNSRDWMPLHYFQCGVTQTSQLISNSLDAIGIQACAVRFKQPVFAVVFW